MESGELRFRLQKNDGTAYIRTEAPPGGGWQRAHFHNKVCETYIVQKGWIGYAEVREAGTHFHVFEEGALFTTPPDLIHNVYLPANAVVHTVKHGDSAGEHRLEDERTDAFTETTRAVTEAELRKAAKTTADTVGQMPAAAWSYSEVYRHFDNLIWQASAWSTGLFTLALAGMTQVGQDSLLVRTAGIRYEYALGLFSLLFCGFVLVISHALYRFRWHQGQGKDYRPRLALLSPQVGLQLMVNFQAGVLALVAFSLFYLPQFLVVLLPILAVLGVQIYQEIKITKVKAPRLTARETRS